MLRGGLRTPKLKEVWTFGDGAMLDVPGSLRGTLTPGHTPPSAALHVPSRRHPGGGTTGAPSLAWLTSAHGGEATWRFARGSGCRLAPLVRL
jgi:hypothetical protein